jgi:hypothetical protein
LFLDDNDDRIIQLMASIVNGNIDAIGFEFVSLRLLGSTDLVKVVFVDSIFVQGSFDATAAAAAADADACLVEAVMI